LSATAFERSITTDSGTSLSSSNSTAYIYNAAMFIKVKIYFIRLHSVLKLSFCSNFAKNSMSPYLKISKNY